MDDGQPLPGTGEKDGMGTHDVAGTDARDAYFSFAACALPGASAQRVRVRIETAGGRGGLGQRERGARRRVDLVLVMCLGDLDVEFRGQRARGDAHELLSD